MFIEIPIIEGVKSVKWVFAVLWFQITRLGAIRNNSGGVDFSMVFCKNNISDISADISAHHAELLNVT